MAASPTPEQPKLADSELISTESVPAHTELTLTDAPATAADSAPPAATAGSPPPVTSSSPAPAPAAETTTTTESAPAPAAPPRERELVADPRLNTLRAMFPDFDDSLLQSVLDSVQGNTDRAIDALLGMSDPDYQGEPGAQQTQQRPQTQEELDEQLARTLMLQDQQDHDNAARQHAWQAQQQQQQQQGRPEPRRQGSSGGPERDTMQEFSEQFNKFAESGRKTLGTFFNKVKAKIQELDQPQGGQSSGNATHGGVGGDTYPYESQYNPYPDTSHQQRNDNSNNPNPHQQMPAYYDPNAAAGDGDRFGSGPHSPTGYDATPAPGAGGPGTPAPPSTQSGAPQIDGGKLGMLPKRPVSLLATSPQPSSAHTGAPPSSDDDDALEYAENPFEEDKTRK
ncbi:CUE domain-containing protein [Favolaschia claudopus]|uniref:CUE domain-containing protein n=1 Tax=Favolaschia claudopus TaxID=2862362 RepID=A0AAW0ABR5_9AGAR